MYEAAIPDPARCLPTLAADVADWLQRMTPVADSSIARFAATLTFDAGKMHRKCWSGVLTQDVSLAFAKRNFSAFRALLDRAVLKSAASRHGRELTYIPVIEGQGIGKVLHYHCVIATPAWVTLTDIIPAVKKAWLATEFGGVQIDVQAMRDDGWLTYMSKEAWKPWREVVDVENVRLSAHPKRC